MGHEGVLTTFYSYGEVAAQRQEEIIRSLAEPQDAACSDAEAIAEAVVRQLRRSGSTE